MLSVHNIIFFLSIFFPALIAGLLYSYVCSVNPGLAKLSDSEYIKAMQAINTAIQNPLFFLSFIGTLLILPIAAWYSFVHQYILCFYLLLGASLVYIIGVFGVTAFGNVPLNNSLANIDITSGSATILGKQRRLFETNWNYFHWIRTLCSLLTLAFTIIAVQVKH